MTNLPSANGAVAADGRQTKLRPMIAAVLACVTSSFPLISSALPVIPGAAGFGMDTPAGRGGQIIKVTNLNDSGSGSLRACVQASGPRVCVFEVSGTIRMTNDLSIENDKITIAGQTAPSPGILLRGAALRISASDVLVQHLRVRVGDDPNGPDPSNRDALKIESPMTDPIKNIVVDHCSFSWAVDETVTMWNAWDNVTLSNNIIAEGLLQSIKSNNQTGGYGLLVGPTDGRASIVGNLLAHNKERNPLSRGKQMVFVNNVVYNRLNMDVDLQSADGRVTSSTVMGNVFMRGADYARTTKPILVRTDSEYGVPSASKVYVADNSAVESVAGNEWSVVGTNTSASISDYKASLPPVWPSGLTALPTSGGNVLNKVLKSAGARPADRDSVDRRVVQGVRDNTGRIINCVSSNGTERCTKNAGGWPSLANNRRALTLPSDPHLVTASGYTKLEVWLHQKAAEVEGRPAAPQAPVLAIE